MKLSIVGRGVRPLEHLTLAGLRALKNADVVLGIEPDKAAWEALSKEFALPPLHSLDFLYRDGVSDINNYSAFYQLIIETCNYYDHVALVIAGHPRLAVTISQWFARKSLPAYIDLEVIEGVSSFAAMYNDLKRDPLEKGTAILDANRLLLFKYIIEPTVDTFIYHVSSVGNVQTDYVDSTQRNRLQLLTEYLLGFYPKDTSIILCKAANIKGGQSEYISLQLDDLIDNSLLIDPGTTLFIPGLRPKQFSSKFLATLRSSHASAQMHS